MRTMWKLAASAALATTAFAAPAMAQYYPADPYYGRYGGGIDPADPRFGQAIGGAMAAMTGVIARAVNDAHRSVRLPSDDYDYDDYDRSADTEEAAVDACAVAAQQEATRIGRIATVEDIVDVDREDDGWTVEGTVETRNGYRDSRSEEWRFSCSVRYGRVEHVEIDGAPAASGY